MSETKTVPATKRKQIGQSQLLRCRPPTQDPQSVARTTSSSCISDDGWPNLASSVPSHKPWGNTCDQLAERLGGGCTITVFMKCTHNPSPPPPPAQGPASDPDWTAARHRRRSAKKTSPSCRNGSDKGGGGDGGEAMLRPVRELTKEQLTVFVSLARAV